MASALPGSSRARRIRKRPEFVRIQGRGVRVTTAHLVFLLAAQAEPGPSRLGITASRKVGNAVVRNRAKRLVREAFRLHGELTPPAIDLVVIVRSDLDALGLAGVVAEWRGVFGLLARRAATVAERSGGPQARSGHPGQAPS